MKIDAAAVRQCLKSFDFTTLFREHLGWDNLQTSLSVAVDGHTFSLTAALISATVLPTCASRFRTVRCV